MDIVKLNTWWQSLKIAEKERIAKKVTGAEKLYPSCTWVWTNLSYEEKLNIYKHCTDKHGLLLEEWQEGKSMSY